MIKITGKYEEQIEDIVKAYMERNGIKTKSEAVLKMVLTFDKQAKEILKLHNVNVKLEEELEAKRYAVDHIKKSIQLINEL